MKNPATSAATATRATAVKRDGSTVGQRATYTWNWLHKHEDALVMICIVAFAVIALIVGNR